MVKLIFSPQYIFYIQEILTNKILDFLPLKVMHDVKYSCWKQQFIGKLKEIKFWCSRKFASQNISLVAIFKSLSMQNLKILQIFGLAKLSAVLKYKFQNW